MGCRFPSQTKDCKALLIPRHLTENGIMGFFPSQIRLGPTQLYRDKGHIMIKSVKLLSFPLSRELASQKICD